MRVAIMQPYFFPYLAYFQLINAVDEFIVYDDVQYINRGWINRNRIQLNGKPFKIVLPLIKDSSKKNINERFFIRDVKKAKAKILLQVTHAYKKAPFFNQFFPEFSRILFTEIDSVSIFNSFIISELCNMLKVNTKISFSSELNINRTLTGEQRIIRINEILGSTDYLNPIGGFELYNKEAFHKKGIELRFLKTGGSYYKQSGNIFIQDLSIIDVLMYNSKEETQELLEGFKLI